jgi:hypothetical protein
MLSRRRAVFRSSVHPQDAVARVALMKQDLACVEFGRRGHGPPSGSQSRWICIGRRADRILD